MIIFKLKVLHILFIEIKCHNFKYNILLLTHKKCIFYTKTKKYKYVEYISKK